MLNIIKCVSDGYGNAFIIPPMIAGRTENPNTHDAIFRYLKIPPAVIEKWNRWDYNTETDMLDPVVPIRKNDHYLALATIRVMLRGMDHNSIYKTAVNP